MTIHTPITELRVQRIETSGSSVAIDISQGQYVILTLRHHVSSITFTGFTTGELSRCTLEVRTTIAGDITNWGSILWESDDPPTLTAQGRDIFLIHSPDGGSKIYGSTVGQNYS